jgi:hypothetical protein
MNILGYLVLWRIPDLKVSYEALAQIGMDARFDESFIPSPPKQRGAWEKATQLGAGGIKIPLHQEKLDEIKKRYGVVPVVRLFTKIISRQAPHLIRHIAREVYIPVDEAKINPGEAVSKERLAQEQFRPKTVAILEYDTESGIATAVGQKHLADIEGWTNGEVQKLVDQLLDDIDTKMNYADSDAVRHSVRDWLLGKGGTLQSSGGAYFLPFTEDKIDQLKSLKVFVESLAEYRSNEQVDPPQVLIFPLTEDGDLLDTRLDVAQNAVKAFSGQLADLLKEIQPVLDGGRTENVSRKISERARAQLNEIMINIAQYRLVLRDNLSQLDTALAQAQATLDKANGINAFRQPATRRGLADKEVEAVPLTRASRGLKETEVEVTTTKRQRRQLQES